MRKSWSSSTASSCSNILVSTTDGIYVMFAAGSFAVGYVSPNVKKLLGISVSDVMRDIRALTESAVDPSWGAERR